MALRIVQVSTLWFWIAFTIFVLALLHLNQTQDLLPLHTSENATPRKAALTTRQRMARSESSWESSVSLRHQMAAAHPKNPNIPLFPAQTLAEFGKYPYTLWDFFPATYSCPHNIERVGRLGDGGKWVCGMALYEERPVYTSKHKDPSPPEHSDTILYSFGVNYESSFEGEMIARIPSLKIFAFDFSVENFGPALSGSSRAFFSKVGLGAKDEPTKSPPFYTLRSLMKQNNHTYIDILKIDIEGSEYTALDSFMDSFDQEKVGVMPVGQVMIELHLVDDQHVNFERFTKWWERLERFGMRPTWLEVNLMAVTLGQGKTDPRCVEYVWVNANDKKNILWQE